MRAATEARKVRRYYYLGREVRGVPAHLVTSAMCDGCWLPESEGGRPVSAIGKETYPWADDSGTPSGAAQPRPEASSSHHPTPFRNPLIHELWRFDRHDASTTNQGGRGGGQPSRGRGAASASRSGKTGTSVSPSLALEWSSVGAPTVAAVPSLAVLGRSVALHSGKAPMTTTTTAPSAIRSPSLVASVAGPRGTRSATTFRASRTAAVTSPTLSSEGEVQLNDDAAESPAPYYASHLVMPPPAVTHMTGCDYNAHFVRPPNSATDYTGQLAWKTSLTRMRDMGRIAYGSMSHTLAMAISTPEEMEALKNTAAPWRSPTPSASRPTSAMSIATTTTSRGSDTGLLPPRPSSSAVARSTSASHHTQQLRKYHKRLQLLQQLENARHPNEVCVTTD